MLEIIQVLLQSQCLPEFVQIIDGLWSYDGSWRYEVINQKNICFVLESSWIFLIISSLGWFLFDLRQAEHLNGMIKGKAY